MSKALIAMSGGVDSTLAAKLTQDMGHQCVGCTIRFFDKKILPPPASGEAPAVETAGADDTADARAAADKLGIPFHVLDYTEEFADKILNYFVRSYENAATPNPCIECNRHLKFGKLMEDMKDLGCDYVVTGHYARIEKEGDKYYLKKAMDENKDQSYFLHSLTQERLAHVLFPLGSMHKSEVREAADNFGFRNAHKSDSQDICFIKDGDYARFICHYAGKTYPGGDFVDAGGKVLGKHKGIIHYTIGQRKGLGVSFSKPLFVRRLNMKENTVLLTDGADLFETTVMVRDFNWISGETPAEPFRCKARIRYRHKEQDAWVTPLPDGQVKIVFDEPQRAVTPGQSAVLYDGDVVLGGGTIYI